MTIPQYRKLLPLTLLVCLSSSLTFADPIRQKEVFFDNRSQHTIYLLPEKGGNPIPVPADTKIYQPLDAFADIELYLTDSRFAVFKVVDNISIVYFGRDDAQSVGGSLREKIGQATMGGWKDDRWTEENPYFGDFLNKALEESRP